MLSTELSTVFLFASFVLSVLAMAFSLGCLRIATRVWRKNRDIRAIVMQLMEMDDSLEALSASHKRLRSRVGMRELRSKRKEGENGNDEAPYASVDVPPQLGPEEREIWKRQMRILLHRGELKP